MAQCKKCGDLHQEKDLKDGICQKCRDISPEEEYEYTEDSEYNEEDDAILIQSIVDNVSKEIENRENTQYITRVISAVLTIGMLFFFFHVIKLVASEEKVENETAQEALDVISIGINPAIIGVPLVINSTVDCDQEMVKHALVLAMKDEVSSKKVSLVSNPYGYVGHIPFFNDIKMLKMDNLKTYCEAYIESPYGNIPIEYTTQKAGFLEVYVEITGAQLYRTKKQVEDEKIKRVKLDEEQVPQIGSEISTLQDYNSEISGTSSIDSVLDCSDNRVYIGVSKLYVDTVEGNKAYINEHGKGQIPAFPYSLSNFRNTGYYEDINKKNRVCVVQAELAPDKKVDITFHIQVYENANVNIYMEPDFITRVIQEQL